MGRTVNSGQTLVKLRLLKVVPLKLRVKVVKGLDTKVLEVRKHLDLNRTRPEI